jgi:serine/threonine protein kinase
MTDASIHRNFGNLRGPPGRPKLADFGLAVRGSEGPHNHPIQPDLLQAPEVILRAGWSYSVGVWNLGVMVPVFVYTPVWLTT